jgi:hypothetical protein
MIEYGYDKICLVDVRVADQIEGDMSGMMSQRGKRNTDIQKPGKEKMALTNASIVHAPKQ